MDAITNNIQAQAAVESVKRKIALIIPTMTASLMGECDDFDAAMFGALDALRECMQPLDVAIEYLGE